MRGLFITAMILTGVFATAAVASVFTAIWGPHYWAPRFVGNAFVCAILAIGCAYTGACIHAVINSPKGQL